MYRECLLGNKGDKSSDVQRVFSCIEGMPSVTEIGKGCADVKGIS